jgi:dihydrolipoamide dehydrogenase
VKFIADAETDELLGCHMMGANASDLIQEVVLAFEYRGSSEDMGSRCTRTRRSARP